MNKMSISAEWAEELQSASSRLQPKWLMKDERNSGGQFYLETKLRT
jgi:hypothetical protein